MIMELIAVVLIISACLAIYLDEAIYSVVSLAFVFAMIIILYALSGASHAAIFQIAIGTGTLVALFLTGEMFSEAPKRKKQSKKILGVAALALLISLPSILLSIEVTPVVSASNVSFAEALWALRSADVVLQGLVIVAVAIGIAIILYEKTRRVED
ncbi:MAG: hypothetical protein N3F10_05345 [Candidatus Bathyarchaeota archaeon]|nr:hypothetical protein [Candidatus Bathyarchaeota archaeon]MCX8177702.1 hypothetical protein [Candidatus Bathyarchaeota archaeon]MDW8193962.1 hypothetical protein [Nitrososphaerota archaeon]